MTTTDNDWSRLIAAATHRLPHESAPQSASEIMALASNLGSGIDPDSIGCSITMVDGHGFVTPAASSPQALGLDESQYLHNDGPCVAAARTGDWHDIELIRSEERWPYFTATALSHGVHSSLSVPLTLPARPAALNLYSAGERAFTDAQKRAVVDFLARCLSRAVTLLGDGQPPPEPAGLRESEARGRIVTRAVAAIRARRGGSERAAFGVLADASSVQARPLLWIADEVLAGRGPSARPDEPVVRRRPDARDGS